MRHTGPVRFRFTGPEARRYVSQARTILGRWLATIPDHQQDGVYRYRLPDGTLFDITLIGRDPTIEITAASVPQQQGGYRLAGFILTPSSTAYPAPDGLDASFPQVVLSPVVGQRGAYACWFSNADTEAVRIARIPRRYLPLAPAGFKEFGEFDWQGDEGRSLSIRGPAARYFPDLLWATTFDNMVWSCGRALFDGDEYAARPGADARAAWEVVGAAMRFKDGALWLVCVHCDRVSSPSDQWLTGPGATHNFVVIEYLLNLITFAATDTHAALLEFETRREFTPFCFSAGGSKAIRVITKYIPATTTLADFVERIDLDALEFTSEQTVVTRTSGTTPIFSGFGYTATRAGEQPVVAALALTTNAAVSHYSRSPVAADFVGEAERFIYAEFDWSYSDPSGSVTFTVSYSHRYYTVNNVGDTYGVDAPTCDAYYGGSGSAYDACIIRYSDGLAIVERDETLTDTDTATVAPAFTRTLRLDLTGDTIADFTVYRGSATTAYTPSTSLLELEGLSFSEYAWGLIPLGGFSGPGVDVASESFTTPPTSGTIASSSTRATDAESSTILHADIRSGLLSGHTRVTQATTPPFPTAGSTETFRSYVAMPGGTARDAAQPFVGVHGASGNAASVAAGLNSHSLTALDYPGFLIAADRSLRAFVVFYGSASTLIDSTGAGTVMEDRVRTKNGATVFGTWGYIAGAYCTSMASFSNAYFNTLTAALMSSVTGVQGVAAFFPGSVMPRYLPES